MKGVDSVPELFFQLGSELKVFFYGFTVDAKDVLHVACHRQRHLCPPNRHLCVCGRAPAHLSLSLSHTLSLTHARTRARAHTHTHTHTLLLLLSLALSLRDDELRTLAGA
jgi:hypothetical protein